MKKVWKIAALMLSLVLILGCFAACGEKTPTNGEEGTTAGEVGTTVAAQSARLADGVLTVGTNAAFPPFEYLGDDGEPDGFDIALIEAIGEKLGVTVEVMDMEFDSLCTSVGNRIDVAIAGMTVDPEREQTVTFSDNYYKAIQNVLVAADNTEITDMASLEGKAIGVQQGTTGDMIATDEIPNAEVKRYNTFALAVEDLKNGNLDAVIIDQNPAEVFAAENEGVLTLLGAENFGFVDEYYAIACPKDDSANAVTWNSLIDVIAQSAETCTADGLNSYLASYRYDEDGHQTWVYRSDQLPGFCTQYWNHEWTYFEKQHLPVYIGDVNLKGFWAEPSEKERAQDRYDRWLVQYREYQRRLSRYYDCINSSSDSGSSNCRRPVLTWKDPISE